MFNRSDSISFDGIISGHGTLTQDGSGTLATTGQNSYSGATVIASGIYRAGAAGTFSPNSAFNIAGGAMLDANGFDQTVSGLDNQGLVAINRSGSGAGALLSVTGNYHGGTGSVLAINTVLGDDASATDRLVIGGNSSGQTQVLVTNHDGHGARTTEGIEIISIAGQSAGSFALQGDFIIAGAYTYRLHKGNASGSDSKDWYLRSALSHPDPTPPVTPPNPVDPVHPIDPVNPGKPVDPIAPVNPDKPQPAPEPEYHLGAPVYQAYPQALLALNGVNAMQQRVGNRLWAASGNRVIVQGVDAVQPMATPEEAGLHAEGNGVWGRIEGAHSHITPRVSTIDTNYQQNSFRLQAGIDGLLAENAHGTLIGGVSGHYVHGKTTTRSVDYANGEIASDGYGFGGTLTWYGNDGFYADALAQATWYNSDLSSSAVNIPALIGGNDGFGYAMSLEAGKKIALDGQWSATPQAQLVWSSVEFDNFGDGSGSAIRFGKGDSLQGRFGIALDYENAWQNAKGLTNRAHVYGIANFYHEFGDGSRISMADVSFATKQERNWGGLGLGGSYDWDNDKYSVYGEGSINTSLSSFGDSYLVKANAGLRVKW